MELKVIKNTGFSSPEFPFKTVFSLVPLINKFWAKAAPAFGGLTSQFAQIIKARLENAPELYQPITDTSVIEKHKDLVDAMMSMVFPAATREMDFYAAIPPFGFRSFYQTPAFKRLNLFNENSLENNFAENVNVDGGFDRRRSLFAYLMVLREFYKIDIHMEYPWIYQLKDEKTGLDKYYRLRIFAPFVDIKLNGAPELLTEDNKKKLFNNLLNEEVWREVIKPEQFEFYGFIIVNAVDVTAQEVISSLKYDLIDKDSIISSAKFTKLEHKIRSLLKKPDLQLGLVALTKHSLDLHDHVKLIKSFVLDETCICDCPTCAGTVYDRMLSSNDFIIINDLKKYEGCTQVELAIIDQGIRNLTLAPLVYNDETIGIMELGSPNPGDLNEINSMLLKEVLPLFAMCVKRSMDDFNSQIQALIKEKCTAIHPSVEWRFRKAAVDYLNKQKDDVYAEMDEIIFEDVYPLFAESDIRDSSLHRNASIRADLKENLETAKSIIELSNRFKHLPILDELDYKIRNKLKSLEKGLSSGDEPSILGFLHDKVEVLFGHLKTFDARVNAGIDEYTKSKDQKLGFLYKRRKDFEDSVALINETISSYVDYEEERAQKMFPHYFEKYKTDGVEHGIYVGASLVEDGNFNLMYLRNLRLWQLMILCNTERKVQAIKPHLKIPLETAHLVLVQNTPLTVKFHYDEKKFDVDGTYNIRYEIMKKRIDKAVARGREDRITQAGKIAIIYSNESEASEYSEYIEFLQSKNYLTAGVEELELDELQGIEGLKALRVTIDTKSESQPHVFTPEKILHRELTFSRT